MKVTITTLLFAFVTCSAFSQDITGHVINAGSGDLNSEDVVISYYIGDFILELEDVSGITSLQEILEEDLELFPNPVQDILFIRTQLMDLDQFALYNLDGRLIRLIPADQTRIDFTHYESGLYFLEVIDLDGSVIGKLKIIKN